MHAIRHRERIDIRAVPDAVGGREYSGPRVGFVRSDQSIGSVSVGDASVPANSCTDTSQTVTGAATTMPVSVSPSEPLGTNWTNFTWSGYVSASNTVQIHICNVTVGALTPEAQTFEIRVIQ